MLHRGTGTTQSERFLVQLAERSCLRLWTYPNLFRDQGGGKEVCDLVVAFDDVFILFSDKQIAFQQGPLDKAWTRWKRRAVLNSIDQLVGAKRWILNHPNRLFLDPECKQRFPLRIDPNKAKFFLVAVAVGASEACRKELGGTGSLMISDAPSLSDQPFAVATRYGEEVVQVLDEITLPIVLRHLDTVPDLIGYLTERERLCRSERFGMATGEENMLAFYLSAMLSGDPTLSPERPGRMLFAEDLWEGFSAEEEFQEYQEFLAPAYTWDTMLEQFNDFVLAGTMEVGNEGGVAGHESRLRALARTTRLERRQLAVAFAGLFQIRSPETALFRCTRLNSRLDTIYAFVVMPGPEHRSEEYRSRRLNALSNYCLSIKAAHAEVLHVVGIATSPVRKGLHSEDVCYVDGTNWDDEAQATAERVRAETGLYTNPKAQELTLSAAPSFIVLEQRKARNAKKRARRARRGSRS